MAADPAGATLIRHSSDGLVLNGSERQFCERLDYHLVVSRLVLQPPAGRDPRGEGSLALFPSKSAAFAGLQFSVRAAEETSDRQVRQSSVEEIS
jgi:hypothetical protein